MHANGSQPVTPQDAIQSLPSGRYAVAVSGGADSVCLLHLLDSRRKSSADVSLRVVHLDHQLRGPESDADARFVRELSDTLGLPCDIALRSDIDRQLNPKVSNPSARYRAARMAFFLNVIATHSLDGVVLGHHATDQAETVLQRLLRGSGPPGLAGMAPIATVNRDGRALNLFRPLLNIWPAQLRQYLQSNGLAWREDASNQSNSYQRNRLRRWLTSQPALLIDLIETGLACSKLRRWVTTYAPKLSDRFSVTAVQRCADALVQQAVRRWLREQQVPIDAITPGVVERLLTMTRDAATPARQAFPGNVMVRRRGGVIWAETSA